MRVTVRALLAGAAASIIALTAACVAAGGAILALSAAPARASAGQVAMFEDDAQLYSDPAATLAQLRGLGVGVIRVAVHWGGAMGVVGDAVPRGFTASSPSSPGYDWAALDAIVRQARADGIAVDLTLSGPPPRWAVGTGAPAGARYPEWRPSPRAYGAFVQAIAARYSGHFQPSGASTPLPAIHWWELWNEPNFGQELAPQAIRASAVPSAPEQYRALLNAAWRALRATHHLGDVIIIGNLDARGQAGPPGPGAPEGYPGDFGDTKPLIFVRELYCVDARFRPLRGRVAAAQGCPATPAAGRRFRSRNPALFSAAGFGDHPYPYVGPPTVADSRDPNFAEFSELPRLSATLSRALAAYGSRHRFTIYNNEYGYITDPPNHSRPFASPARAALYLNWAEYLSWRNPQIGSITQYLLEDPAPGAGGFDTGLEFYGGAHKPTYDAYRLPLFLPYATVKRGASTLVWGCARPVHAYGARRVAVQFRPVGHGAWRTVRTVVITSSRGYFEVRVRFPSSGAVRLAWSYPGGPTVHSRTATLTVR